MSSKIVLFGATGYTGARTAEAMTRRGLQPVLAGRDKARLDTIAQRLGGLSTARADATDPASVRALIDSGDVLVSTVGPFQKLGEAVVAAAVDAGAVYFDSTGEPPFVRRVFEHHGPAAARTGAALITAFGNDYVPGTLAGALALTEAGVAASSVHIGYFITGGRGQGFSKGTLNSLVGVLLEPMYSWRDGALVDEPAGRRYRTFQVAGRARPGVSIGATDQFALPRLAATGVAPRLRDVDTYLGWFGPASRAVHLGSRGTPLLAKFPPAARALTAAAGKVVARASEEPSAAALASSTSYFVSEAYDASGGLLSRVLLTAPDGYAITAELLAWGAGHAQEHGVIGSGALDAVSAFGLDTLKKGAEQANVVVQS
ncbi:saccharopine dehydrogenase family protein [Pseudonocardia spinosispora]|uniref:saccharopine dehydrogenase family protein n=1 Tax=Pseudonocardia spinosispora TaxID=103441 RepID=UPI0003FF544B|nr:saccharopine dehydrogenase NADP-binding domain-containing protein [Pseudonocardia spinosispora]